MGRTVKAPAEPWARGAPILLDTHTLLWLVSAPDQVSHAARKAIADPSREVVVSAVSAWEIAIKARMGRLDAEPLLSAWTEIMAAMAITEPSFGSDSAAVSTTATLDGDEYVINGEKIYVTAGSRASHIVVWATLDRTKGRAAIKSFIVPREHPGVTVERVEHKLGIKASDTAAIRFDNARIPKENLLGSPEIKMDKGFAGVMETFDSTRPIVAAMALGVARAALEELRIILTDADVEISYDKPAHAQSAPAAEFLRMEADWEAAYLLTVRSAWQADNAIPNSKEASMGKAKAARVASDITLKAVEMAGTTGYSEQTLLEKWARDSKILDIFEGTQQIQLLVVARRLLGLSSAELK